MIAQNPAPTAFRQRTYGLGPATRGAIPFAAARKAHVLEASSSQGSAAFVRKRVCPGFVVAERLASLAERPVDHGASWVRMFDTPAVDNRWQRWQDSNAADYEAACPLPHARRVASGPYADNAAALFNGDGEQSASEFGQVPMVRGDMCQRGLTGDRCDAWARHAAPPIGDQGRMLSLAGLAEERRS